MQLSVLRKLTSLVAGECATHHLLAMLPALRALKLLKCIVSWFHFDGSGALPILSELTALEELRMEGRCVGHYKLAFPPSLKVPALVLGRLHALFWCTAKVSSLHTSSRS